MGSGSDEELLKLRQQIAAKGERGGESGSGGRNKMTAVEHEGLLGTALMVRLCEALGKDRGCRAKKLNH